jgi:acetoin utilization deacetylase AcuC-like enzyme
VKIYSKFESDPELTEWGILVPLLKSRAIQICEELEKHPGLRGKVGILNNFFLSKSDIVLSGHDKDFIEAIFSNDDTKVDPLLQETYELIKPDGSFYRFDPTLKKRRFHELFLCQLAEASNSYQCARKALQDNAQIFYLSGGMHHAMTSGGRGFCLINDAVIAIRKLQREKKIKSAWVIDVDVHKGDGTAEMSVDDDSIITMSVHMKNGWPLDMGEGPWTIPSNLDVEIEDNDNENYLINLREGLGKLRRSYNLPDFIFINLGGDPYEKDSLQSSELIQLSREQMLQRNKMLYHFAADLGAPTLWTMGGGYGEHSFETYVDFFKSISAEVREADTFEVV